MRPTTVTVTGSSGISSPVVLDYFLDPMNIGLAVTATGTHSSKVQVSYDDPFASYATNYNTDAVWFDHATLTSVTGNAQGSQTTPVRAVRLNKASGTPAVKLTVVQAGARI
jgi:hypothetical protein